MTAAIDQERLEAEDTGYRCRGRGCGITVFGPVPALDEDKLCTACKADHRRQPIARR